MMADSSETDPDRASHKISSINFDEKSLARVTADSEHERRIAIYDLLEDNYFAPEGAQRGPYALKLGVVEARLSIEATMEDGAPVAKVLLSMSPLRRTIKDYFLLCESYYDAIRNAAPEQIETIDMARRSMHNEGAEILIERLKGKAKVDFNTARRLFTLICSLHMR